MSCDGNRQRWWKAQCSPGGAAAALLGEGAAGALVLEQILETERNAARKNGHGDSAAALLLAEQKTVSLFRVMKQATSVDEPAHAAVDPRYGLRLPEDPNMLYGYAAVYDTLQAIEHGRNLPEIADQVLRARRRGRDDAEQPVLHTHVAEEEESPYGADGYDQNGVDINGRDREGYDRFGYNQQGFDRKGRDREGFDAAGYDKDGYNRHGYNRSHYNRNGYTAQGFNSRGFDKEGYNTQGYDAQGYDRAGFDGRGLGKDGYDKDGYNAEGLNRKGEDRFGYRRAKDGVDRDAQGYDRQGYDSTGRDAQGYDRQGYDAQGRDGDGYDRYGFDRNGVPHPALAPDANGLYADGLDVDGYSAIGFNKAGRDRWGFDYAGYNALGLNRKGASRTAVQESLRQRGYDRAGYDAQGWDQLGYDRNLLNRQGYSSTGYDKDGFNRSGENRLGFKRSPTGQGFINPKTGRTVKGDGFNARGFGPDGLDRWGFDTQGLTAPDEHGHQYNYAGWRYDPASNHVVDPADPTRSIPPENRYDHTRGYWRGTAPTIDIEKYARSEPHRPVTKQEYEASEGGIRLSDADWNDIAAQLAPSAPGSKPLADDRRASILDNSAYRTGSALNTRERGIPLRCPACGQWSSPRGHACPSFPRLGHVSVYPSGLAEYGGRFYRPGDPISHANTDMLGNHPHTVPLPARAQTPYVYGGYNGMDVDEDGYDRQGYNTSGVNRKGLTKDGFNRLGYDKDGYDRQGYNDKDLNRYGQRRPRTMEEIAKTAQAEGIEEPILSVDALAGAYSRMVSSYTGEKRTVIFSTPGSQEFWTDMKGTICADPYPLGPSAPAAHNLVCTRGGLQHEMGHDLYTALPDVARAFEIAASPTGEEGLGRAARRMVPQFLNMVEDGRMEWELSRNYPGIAQTLAAFCRLMPRWNEAIGESVPPANEFLGALLYETLPFFKVKPELLAAMKPEARALFDMFAPRIRRNNRAGTTTADSLEIAIDMARALEAAGMFASDNPAPDIEKDVKLPPPPTPPAGTKPSRRKGQAGQQGQAGGGQQSQGGQQGEDQGNGGAGGSQGQQGSAGQQSGGGGSSDGSQGQQSSAGQQSGGGSSGGSQGQQSSAGQQSGGAGGSGGSQGQQDQNDERTRSGRRPRGTAAEDDQPGSGRRPKGAADDDDEPSSGRHPRGAADEDDRGGGRSPSGAEDDELGSGRWPRGAAAEDDASTGRQSGSAEDDVSTGRQSGTAEDDRNNRRQPSGAEDDTSGGRQSGTAEDAADAGRQSGSAEDEASSAPQPESPENQPESGDSRHQGSETPSNPQQPGAPVNASDRVQRDDDRVDGAFEGDDDVFQEFSQSDEAFEAALRQAESVAVNALEREVKRRSKHDTFGPRLHQPLGQASSRRESFRDFKGQAQQATVAMPRATDSVVASLAPRHSQHRGIAGALAKRLAAVKDNVERRDRLQDRGKLDRTRFANAIAGAKDVYTRDRDMPATSFAVSVAVDLSGSMNRHMASGALYDAAMVLGQTFEILDMPYEMRGFSEQSLHYKAMDDKTMDPARAAMLTKGPGGGTTMYATAGLATTSLGGRKEKNRLFISLTDGALDDHMQTVQQLAKAREQGITTFGIFLGAGVNAERMDELYGRGNWTSINELKQMPIQVGSRIEKMLKSAR